MLVAASPGRFVGVAGSIGPSLCMRDLAEAAGTTTAPEAARYTFATAQAAVFASCSSSSATGTIDAATGSATMHAASTSACSGAEFAAVAETVHAACARWELRRAGLSAPNAGAIDLIERKGTTVKPLGAFEDSILNGGLGAYGSALDLLRQVSAVPHLQALERVVLQRHGQIGEGRVAWLPARRQCLAQLAARSQVRTGDGCRRRSARDALLG